MNRSPYPYRAEGEAYGVCEVCERPLSLGDKEVVAHIDACAVNIAARAEANDRRDAGHYAREWRDES